MRSTERSLIRPADFLADVRNGVWGELDQPKVTIDAYRRNLQRAYLEIANNKLNAAPQAAPQGLPAGFAGMFVTSGDERGYYRSEFRTLQSSVSPGDSKGLGSRHSSSSRSGQDEITKILNPDKDGAERATGNANRRALELLELYYNPTSCWPDDEIKP